MPTNSVSFKFDLKEKVKHTPTGLDGTVTHQIRGRQGQLSYWLSYVGGDLKVQELNADEEDLVTVEPAPETIGG